MVATVAAPDSAKVQNKKYSVFIYSEAEPHAKYAIYKQTRTLCVLQYLACIIGLLCKWILFLKFCLPLRWCTYSSILRMPVWKKTDNFSSLSILFNGMPFSRNFFFSKGQHTLCRIFHHDLFGDIANFVDSRSFSMTQYYPVPGLKKCQH